MSVFEIAGLVVLAAAILVLLISLLHPEGRKRPGGYLDGHEPQPKPRDEEQGTKRRSGGWR
ncbi:MAG TPA: hypothetical protein VFU94_14270 [Conexibacter sp.]|nr:hypothetical protein [Conexibacter sp.]